MKQQRYEQIINNALGWAKEVGEDCLNDLINAMGLTLEEKCYFEVNSEDELPPLQGFELIVAYIQYDGYVEKWKKDHAGTEFKGMEPACFEEWCDNERRKMRKKNKKGGK